MENTLKTNVNINIPKKYIQAIKEVDYEGREDGYWCYLKEGYVSENGHGCQTIHAYTKKELLEQIRKIVKE